MHVCSHAHSLFWWLLLGVSFALPPLPLRGRRATGDLECHTNGFRFVSGKGVRGFPTSRLFLPLPPLPSFCSPAGTSVAREQATQRAAHPSHNGVSSLHSCPLAPPTNTRYFPAPPASPQETLSIIFSNIKHAFFQPASNDLLVLLHFRLHSPILVGKRRTADVQFYTEVMDASKALGPRAARGNGRSRRTRLDSFLQALRQRRPGNRTPAMHGYTRISLFLFSPCFRPPTLPTASARSRAFDADELEEERREKELKRKINEEYRNFVQRVEEYVWRGHEVTWGGGGGSTRTGGWKKPAQERWQKTMPWSGPPQPGNAHATSSGRGNNQPTWEA